MHPSHPDKDAFRNKFLDEHTHSEDEVRFFVRGQGLFVIHANGRVYSVLCAKNDLISVPANTRHWFDMGPNPSFTAIRLFSNPDGWVANFTKDTIARRFPLLQN
jgi:1,2-dihydroxy-3-keto-5-methylthiopentene dioxygenase